MIVSSFQTQYGIRLSREIHTMQWGEFTQLLSGIGPDTPLGRIVSIRTETDRNILKNFTKEQRRIRDEWNSKKAQNRTISQKSKREADAAIEQIKQAFISMAGGVTKPEKKKGETDAPDVL